MHNLSKKTLEAMSKLTPEEREQATRIAGQVVKNRAEKMLRLLAKAKLKGETDGKTTNTR